MFDLNFLSQHKNENATLKKKNKYIRMKKPTIEKNKCTYTQTFVHNKYTQGLKQL